MAEERGRILLNAPRQRLGKKFSQITLLRCTIELTENQGK